MWNRRMRLDLSACVLLVCGLLVGLCLLSHDAGHEHKNIFGSAGTWLAQSLYESLGLAVYFLLASWIVLAVRLFVRRNLLTWSLRLAGWLLLLPCSAVAADYLGWRLPNAPSTGAGGSIGAWLADWLQTNFQAAGRVTIFGGCTLLGLMLALDFVMLRLLVSSWKVSGWLAQCSGPAGGACWPAHGDCCADATAKHSCARHGASYPGNAGYCKHRTSPSNI